MLPEPNFDATRKATEMLFAFTVFMLAGMLLVGYLAYQITLQLLRLVDLAWHLVIHFLKQVKIICKTKP